MGRFWALGVAALGLSACATPQERCIAAATRDLAVVQDLMDEARGNLQRGYALSRETVYHSELQDCTPAATAAHPNPAPQLCPVQVPSEVQRPVAIDLAAESAKLASLQAKYDQQDRVAQVAIAQCRAVHPK